MIGHISVPDKNLPVFIAGSTKNSGKTSTLNALTEIWRKDLNNFSILTTGRDGEEIDAVYSKPKPPVRIQSGDIAISTRTGIGSLSVNLLELSSVSSNGRLGIFRLLEGGKIEIYGSPSGTATWEQIRALEKYGNLIIVDGSFDRWTVTSLGQCRIIIAVSPTSFPSPESSLNWLEERLTVLNLPYPDESIEFIPEDKTKLSENLFVNRPLTNKNLNEILNSGVSRILVPAPSSIFLSKPMLQRAKDKLFVLTKPVIHGISINSSHDRGSITPKSYFQMVSQRFPEYEVADFYGF
ncbi:hypothetical protein KKF34_11225 [Myxococcota bacterium]|nr:hypothetical protein [Myxococcota bacterium]MBU1382544.1 hypothetical protein [Myxococcota bacterium]MBU1497436.1 hypothetical protein [Myxococcota bacterium]